MQVAGTFKPQNKLDQISGNSFIFEGVLKNCPGEHAPRPP